MCLQLPDRLTLNISDPKINLELRLKKIGHKEGVAADAHHTADAATSSFGITLTTNYTYSTQLPVL